MKKNHKDKGIDFVLIVAGILCLIVFVTTGFLLLKYWYESIQQEKINQQLADLKHGTAGGAMYVQAEPVLEVSVAEKSDKQEEQESDFSEDETQVAGTGSQETESITEKSLAEMNPDYIMWLQIEGTKIDYPVVQRDNSYYLKHDFYGEENKHGTIFLDEKCKSDGRFLLLHGHHMKDGTMFGGLKNYKKADYRELYSALSLDWGTIQEQYVIFAGALIDLLQAERFCYEDLPEDDDEIKLYMQQLREASFWYEEPQIETDGRFVILSTCDYGTKEQRLILVATEKK